MPREKQLDYVILGLLSHEDMTGYEMKKRIDSSLSFFYNASFGSIYPTLNCLSQNGFVISHADAENNRNKITYTITQKGQDCLRDWLQSGMEKNELRYETLLKLFFGNEAGFRSTFNLINRFESDIRNELKTLRLFASNLSSHLEDDSHKYFFLTVKFGIRTYEAYLIWCQEAKELLESWENQ